MARRLGPKGRYRYMALPYITPNQLKSMAEKAKSNGGSAPTKTSQLENDSGFVTLTEADSKYAPKGDYATEDYVGGEVSAAKGEIEASLEASLGEYAKESQIPVAGKDYFGLTDISDGDHPDRHSMMMKNDDSVSGYATDGDSYNLAMVSKWDVADFGSRGLPTNLNGSKARPTYNDDKEIALVEDLPDVSTLATKAEVAALIKPVGEGLQVGDSEHTTNINTTADNKVMINSVGEIVYSTPYPGEDTRKVVQFKNNDQLSGVTTTGAGVPLIFVSKWDKVEVGGSGAPLNLNGSEDRPTYKDDEELAFVSDMDKMPLICTMPFRKVSGYLGDDGKKFSKETVLGWFGVSTIDELKQLVVKKPIYLMYGITLTKNPMYYHIPCQYVAFTANNKLELIADGLDTNNDKLSRYKIVLTFVLASEATVEDTEIAITVDDYIHLPELPEDADAKTYTLKAVNGKVTWVE